MALKENYKDDILDASQNTKRRFKMINNADGTVSFEDVTVYEQVGDSFGAGDINALAKHINAVGDGATVRYVKSESDYLQVKDGNVWKQSLLKVGLTSDVLFSPFNNSGNFRGFAYSDKNTGTLVAPDVEVGDTLKIKFTAINKTATGSAISDVRNFTGYEKLTVSYQSFFEGDNAGTASQYAKLVIVPARTQLLSPIATRDIYVGNIGPNPKTGTIEIGIGSMNGSYYIGIVGNVSNDEESNPTIITVDITECVLS